MGLKGKVKLKLRNLSIWGGGTSSQIRMSGALDGGAFWNLRIFKRKIKGLRMLARVPVNIEAKCVVTNNENEMRKC